MDKRKFAWRNPQFTYADLLSGVRLVMLPYLLYGLAVGQAGLNGSIGIDSSVFWRDPRRGEDSRPSSAETIAG